MADSVLSFTGDADSDRALIESRGTLDILDFYESSLEPPEPSCTPP